MPNSISVIIHSVDFEMTINDIVYNVQAELIDDSDNYYITIESADEDKDYYSSITIDSTGGTMDDYDRAGADSPYLEDEDLPLKTAIDILFIKREHGIIRSF